MYKKTMREALKEARAYRDPIDEGITGNIQKAITIAKKMGGNMTGAVKEIEKIARGLSDEPSVRVALRTANEETITEFKKMSVTFKSLVQMSKASDALEKQGFSTDAKGMVMTVDGKGADLNKYATDMKNYYGATVKAESLEEATPVPPRDLMLTYGKPGEKVKAYYTKFMQDLQNKAHELRKKGFVVDKMGLKQPMSKLRDRIPEQDEEETELVEFTLADYRELESDNQHDIAAKKLIDKFGTSQEKSTINDINRRHAKTGYISGVDFRLRTTIVNRYYSRLK